MMKRKGPSTEPCGTPKRIFRKLLKLEPIFVFFPVSEIVQDEIE